MDVPPPFHLCYKLSTSAINNPLSGSADVPRSHLYPIGTESLLSRAGGWLSRDAIRGKKY